MKVIFVLDDQTVLVAKPEELQLIQVEPHLASVVLPAPPDENGEKRYLPLISYPVSISLVSETIKGGEAVAVPAPAPSVKKKTPAKKAKKKINR